MTHRENLVSCTILLGLLLTVAACGPAASEPAASAPSRTADAPAPPAFEPTDAMLAVLADADRKDGAEDHVVGRCPGCSLAMEGHAEYALDLGGYALHFCSDTCRDHFREHPESGMEALAEAAPTVEVTPGS